MTQCQCNEDDENRDVNLAPFGHAGYILMETNNLIFSPKKVN
ncbi:hypothetical protein OYT1_ch2338 [Ferriphaselus amnicola]|uniref:Uncharacterized protein n=1 Tax=Ferriphaselus amnicola TaxID=1188319 RepID=A0A2Z6GE07_9PROT|nr:hypothetical protein OYT1_ch2338 [Ferriphaselus amnicola]